MKINFTLYSTYMTGGVRAIFEVANGLSKRGHEVIITSLEGDHAWFPLIAKVNYVEKPNFIKILNPLKQIKSHESLRYSSISPILGQMKMGFDADLIKPLTDAIPDCDINVATWFFTTFAVYRSNKGKQFYFFMDFDELAEKHGHYYHMLFKESLYLPLNIITISTWLKEWIMENYSKDACVAGVGIEHNVFYPHPTILENIEGYKIMGIFRGFDYKGDSDLINALNIVFEEIPEINPIIVCSKDTFNDLINKHTFKFQYTFIESPNDDTLAKLYSSSDLFVFASHIEGYGLPPLEAMACGTPVITTDCKGVRDFVVHGKNALIVPAKEPEAIAQSVINMYNNPDLADKLKEEGILTAQKFTWERVVDVFEKNFQDSLNK
ncbi:MAG: glycosyltransferase family 4 protein [Methanobacterium sp.]|nr:glycosyltransferase family 4 protein [Methanobacterium sp.]